MESGTIPPGQMLGVLGGGQLGLMFALAARRMGYRTMIVDPDPDAPAMKIADRPIIGDYGDPKILEELAGFCPAITTEFENVPAESLAFLEQRRIVRPDARSVSTCQDRISEKTFLRDQGFRTVPFLVVSPESPVDFRGVDDLCPGILKSSREGYDGKGQWNIGSTADLKKVVGDRNGSFILEKRIELKTELSIILSRSHDGQIDLYPVVENIHESGILHLSIAPARVPAEIVEEARAVARKIVSALDYTGILAVEYFLDSGDCLHVNELAPRPHNSGHYTIDACVTSQFEQHVRILTGISPGRTEIMRPAAMGNLLGHLWRPGPPDFGPILSCPNAKLYLYGKDRPRPGRKMGHFTVLHPDPSTAYSLAHGILSSL